MLYCATYIVILSMHTNTHKPTVIQVQTKNAERTLLPSFCLVLPKLYTPRRRGFWLTPLFSLSAMFLQFRTPTFLKFNPYSIVEFLLVIVPLLLQCLFNPWIRKFYFTFLSFFYCTNSLVVTACQLPLSCDILPTCQLEESSCKDKSDNVLSWSTSSGLAFY